ncbi:hypothetical protein BDF19DRAFT_419287 [Syncephalis fuscata]|nr:hypothetical protein BDF19DRAFT_419287 [Syncephalis fuscata]
MVTWSDATTSATVRASQSTNAATIPDSSESIVTSSVQETADETVVYTADTNTDGVTSLRSVATSMQTTQIIKSATVSSEMGATSGIHSTSSHNNESQFDGSDRYNQEQPQDDENDDEDDEDRDGQDYGSRRKLRLVGRNFISRWLFLPVFSLLQYSQKHNLTLDIFALPSSESARNVAKRLEKQLAREFNSQSKSDSKRRNSDTHHSNNSNNSNSNNNSSNKEKKKNPSVRRALRRTFLRNHNFLAIWRLFAIAFTYIGAYYLFKNVVLFIETLSKPNAAKSYHETHIYALALLLSIWLASICSHQLVAESTRTGIQVRSAIMALIFRKSLRLHSVELAIGDIVNLLADDVNRLAEAYVHRHYIWSSCRTFSGATRYHISYTYKLGQLISRNSFAMARRTADRVGAISEILTSLRTIKCYAWEVFFRDRVKAIRREELRHLRRSLMAKAWTFMIAFVSPVVLALLCLVMEQQIMGEINMRATHIFTLLSIFNMMRVPLIMLPLAVRSQQSAKVVHNRLDEFFSQPEVRPPLVEPPPADDPKLRIYMNNADFIWEGDVNPTISFLSMTVRAGDIVAVVGDVGAGKSSTILAIMGQLRKSEGIMHLHGSIAYVPSEPWLVSSTLKENIVFGMPYDEHKYRAVIRACALTRDIKSLSRGDDTAIGERGANLTLAQRHRVSIARAVYSDASILLMDDPLSTMDAQIGKHIFNECITGYLKDKAVILVTNQLQLLEKCDQIIVMSDGQSIEQGSFEELIAKDLNLANLVGESIEIEDPYLVDDLVDEIDFQAPSSPHDNDHTNGDDDNEEVLSARQLSKRPRDATNSSGNNQNGTNTSTGPMITFAEVERPDRNVDSATNSNFNTGESSNHPSSMRIPLRGLVNNNSNNNTITGHAATNNSTNHNSSNNSAIPAVNNLTFTGLNSMAIMNSNEFTTGHYTTQHTIMGGTILGTIGHGNTLAKALERSQLTIHSLHDLQGDDTDVSGRGGHSGSSWSAYLLFIRCATGVPTFSMICLFFFIVQSLRIFSDFWLKHYSDEVELAQEKGQDIHSSMSISYLGIYAIAAATYTVGAFIAGQFFYWSMIQKSRVLHKKIFIRILRIPMSYFEYTPIGRILYSFARHQYTVDDVLSEAMLQTLIYVPLLLGVVVAVIIVVPYSIIVALAVFGVIWALNSIALQAERQLRRMEAESKPPIFAHLSATLEGLSSIHVYHAESRFDAANMEKIDANTKALYAVTQLRGWLALYVEFAVSLFVYASELFILFFSSELEEGPAGLVLTNAMQLVVFAQWAIAALREVHDSIGSVEELVKYGKNIPSEAAVVVAGKTPPPDWPSHGKIEFDNIVLRYHRFGAPVVKQSSFVIHAREKIGIVGRTGSGKSTLLISLLRLIEATEGQIRIDGLDISEMGLRDLRRRIAVLPQEPNLFDGTVRSNLDPFDQRTDEEIWGALRAAHLADKIKSMPLRLDASIIENGKGFSLGQKQLFCIARAILSRCRILLMDEATSALDMQTETMIHETIHKNFASYTVLQIGHRLNTIIDSDKIMVMDQGRIVEFNTPRRLLRDENSFFNSLVSQSGEEAARKLREKVFNSATGLREQAREDEHDGSDDEGAVEMMNTSDLSQQPLLSVDHIDVEPMRRQSSHRSHRTALESPEITINPTEETADEATTSKSTRKPKELPLRISITTRSMASIDSERSGRSAGRAKSTATGTPTSTGTPVATEMPLSLGMVFSPPPSADDTQNSIAELEEGELANRGSNSNNNTPAGSLPVSRKSNASGDATRPPPSS